MRKLSQYLLENPIQAMAIALFCALLPLFSLPGSFLAAILIGFITLGKGPKIGLMVLLGAAIPILGFTIWQSNLVISLSLVRCILVWIFASILYATVSWRLMLEVMAIIGILCVLSVHWMIPDVKEWWAGIYQTYLLPLLNKVLSGQLSNDQIQEMIRQTAPPSIATGLFVSLTMFGGFCQLLLARIWQAAVKNPGAFGKEFVEIRAGVILAVIFTIIIITALFQVAIAIDLLPVIILPFTICSLSLVHKWARVNGKIVYLAIAVYIGLIFITKFFILMLALAGYVDSWYDLRKQFFYKQK